MRRGLMLIFLTLLGSLQLVAAQEAPIQSPGSVPIGEGVTIYNSAGEEAAHVTILEVTDPFEEWGEFYAPQVDERYVVATVQIDNTGERPFEFSETDFQVLDSIGRLHWGFPYFRSEIAVAEMPDLEGTSMLPGETVTGALSFVIPNEAQLTQIVFMFYEEQQHLYLLADLAGETLGTPAN